MFSSLAVATLLNSLSNSIRAFCYYPTTSSILGSAYLTRLWTLIHIMGLLGNSALAVFIFLVISLAFLIVTVICRGLYRVYLSRLTGIPGPWLAKATGL